MRYAASRTLVLWTILAVSLSGCAATSAPSERSPLTPGQRKARMLFSTEQAIQTILGRAADDFAVVREEFEEGLAELEPVPMLNVINPILEEYAAAEREHYLAGLAEIRDAVLQRARRLRHWYDDQLWAVAIMASENELGPDEWSRTGHPELDDKVETAQGQLERIVDENGIRQQLTIAEYDRVECDRVLTMELPGTGFLNFFLSAPIPGRHFPDQETIASVYVLQRTELPTSVPLRFLQAARHGVERNGIVIARTPWRWDPGIPGGTGLVPVEPALRDPSYLATPAGFPVVDVTVAGFQSLRDATVTAEYRTAVQRTDTDALIAVVSWKVQWVVDRRGRMRVVGDPAERLVEEDRVIPALLGSVVPAVAAPADSVNEP